MDPDETEIANNNPRFHRGQVVVRVWGTGTKEMYLIHRHKDSEWYIATELDSGEHGEYYLGDHVSHIKKYGAICRLLEEEDGK